MNRLPTVLLAAVLLLAGCRDQEDPVSTELIPAESGLLQQVDNPHFFFLPPLGEQQKGEGTFDDSADLQVEVCLASGPSCDGDPIAVFEADGQGDDRLRVSASHYSVVWHAGRHDLEGGTRLLVVVRAGFQVLGTREIEIVDNAKAKKDVAAGAYALVASSSLPIRFWIEEGAVTPPPSPAFALAGSTTAREATLFDASGTTDPTGTALTYSWSFGDDSRGGGIALAHVYASAGNYDVTLTVRNELGGQASSTQTVSISAPPPPPSSADAVGLIRAQNGFAISGALVTVAGVSGTTDAGGRVELSGIPAGVGTLARIEASGYATQYVEIDAADGASRARFEAVLKERGAAVAVSAATGGTASGADGASVILPAGGIVDGTGQPVSGDIEVRVTPIDVSGEGITAFPGSFAGVSADGTESTLITFGVAEYDLSQSGDPVQLAPGSSATIEIPIYTGGLSLGEMVPLWSLDEVTGVWIQEGEGEVVASTESPTGLALRATVTHFSWWNIDKPTNDLYDAFVQCQLPDTTPVGCTVRGELLDASQGGFYATATVPASGGNLLFLANTDYELRGFSEDGAFVGTLPLNRPVGSGNEVIVLEQAAASPLTSVVTPSSATIEVGGSVLVTVQARTASGDDLTVGGDIVGGIVSSDGILVGGAASFGAWTDNGDGTYESWLVGTEAGPVTAAARINFAQILTGIVDVEIVYPPFTGVLVEELVSGSFEAWHRGVQEFAPGPAFSVSADQHTSSWGNFAMRDLGSEPRQAFNNDPSYGYSYTAEQPWRRLHRVLVGLRDAFIAMDGGVDVGVGGADTPRAQAFGRMMQGLAMGSLAQIYDQAFVLDENADPANLTLVGYDQVMAAALGRLDEAVAIASANNFTIPASWLAGFARDQDQLVELIGSYKARYLATVARTEVERAAVDWDAVLNALNAGLISDHQVVSNGFCFEGCFFDGTKSYGGGNDPLHVWGRIDMRHLGPADQSGAFQNWMALPVEDRTEFLVDTDDRRVTDGTPTGEGLYVRYKGPSPFRPERGTYHFSFYVDHRHEDYGNNSFTGTISILNRAELDFLRAEALYRTGDQAGALAIVNSYRTANGQLPAATLAGDQSARCVPRDAAGACGDLWEVLKYEKRMETWQYAMGTAFFDDRGWGDLVTDTAIQLPVPGEQLLELMMSIYTFGGGGTGSAPVATRMIDPELQSLTLEELQRRVVALRLFDRLYGAELFEREPIPR